MEAGGVSRQMSAARSNSSMRERPPAACESISRMRLLTLKARHSARLRSLPGGSSLTTSAPRSASTRPASQPSRSVVSMINTPDSSMALLFSPVMRGQKGGAKGVYARLRRAMDARKRAYAPRGHLFSPAHLLRRRMGLPDQDWTLTWRSAPGAGERVDPSDHARARVLDVLPAEEVFRLDPIDGIDRTQEVALVAERYRGIDAHAALEIGVRGRPLLLPCGHALGRHEGLTAAARNRVEDVGARIYPRGEAPHDVVHRVGVDVLAHRDCKPHPLRAGERRGEEVALPAFIDLVALLDLDDASAPVGHAVGDHHVLHDARLQPLAQLVERRLAHCGVDIVVIERVYAQREDDRLSLRIAHGHSGHVESRRLVSLAHVARPFRMEMEAALDAGILRLLGLEAAVARIDIAFQHELGIGERHRLDRARLDQPHRRALHGAGNADLVATHRQHRVIETGAGEQGTGRRHAETHGDGDSLLGLVVLVDDLPHVRAGRDLERADIAPAEVHAVVAEVGAAIELRTGDAADRRAHGQLGLVAGMPDRHHVLVDVLW